MKNRLFLLASISALMFASGVEAALVADYQFQSSYSSSVGSPPALMPVATGQSFVTDTVNGSSTTVLQFPEGAGLSLSSTSGVIANGTFSIALLVRLDVIVGYRKYIDFTAGLADTGLYNESGKLALYTTFAGTLSPIQAGAYHHVVITRDGAGNVAGYVDGVTQFSGIDTAGEALIDASNTLRFFVDDTFVTGEESSGAVSRIRIFDTALSPTEVAALGGQPLAPATQLPALSPASLFALLASLLLLAGLALRKRAAK